MWSYVFMRLFVRLRRIIYGRTFSCDSLVDCVVLFMALDAIYICIVFRRAKAGRPANLSDGRPNPNADRSANGRVINLNICV